MEQPRRPSAHAGRDENSPTVLLVFHAAGGPSMSISTLPPLGILMIAANLEKNGITADVVDFSIQPSTTIDADRYDVVGFSVNISNLRSTLAEIARLKRTNPDRHIVAGGPICMTDPDVLLQQGMVDAVFACEGEHALVEYLTTTDRSQVKGIYLKNRDGYSFTGERDWIRDLDALPFPAFDKVDLEKYRNVPSRQRPIISMMTSRGCPFKCIFCSTSMGKDWRPRSPENVVREIKWEVETLGIKEICIYDDNFSLDKERAEAICDKLIEEEIPVKLQFTNGLRVDCLNTRLLRKLKDAGTWLIGLAPETGNPDVMRRIRKGFDHARVMEVREECKNLGIVTFGFFMIGFPFEDKETIEDTIRFSKELDAEIVEFNRVVPYKKTELYEMLKSEGTLLSDAGFCVESYHSGGISTHKVGDLSSKDIEGLVRRSYKEYYLRPSKMLELLRVFSISDLWTLTHYALRTGNV